MQKRKVGKKMTKENNPKYQQIGGIIQASLLQGREFHRNMLREMATSIATGMTSGNTHQNLSPEMIAEDSVNYIKDIGPLPEVPIWDATGTTEPEELVLIESAIQEIKMIMTNYVGIVRSDKRLKRAIKRIKIIYEETRGMYNTLSLSPQLCGLRNMANIAHLITTFALTRKESRGLHYTEDFPDLSEKAENRYLRSVKAE